MPETNPTHPGVFTEEDAKTLLKGLESDLNKRGQNFDPLAASAHAGSVAVSSSLILFTAPIGRSVGDIPESVVEKCDRLIRGILSDEAREGFIANLEGNPRDCTPKMERIDKLRWLAGWDYAESLNSNDDLIDDMKFLLKNFNAYNEEFKRVNGATLHRSVALHAFGTVLTMLEDMGYAWK